MGWLKSWIVTMSLKVNLESDPIQTFALSLPPSKVIEASKHSNFSTESSQYPISSSTWNSNSSLMYPPTPPITIVRPNLRRSQFSSYRSESTSEHYPFSPAGLFSHDEETEESVLDDGEVEPAPNGWTLAQRLRDAALSDWETQRNDLVQPPTLARPPSSVAFSSRPPSQSASSSTDSIPRLSCLRRSGQPVVYPVQASRLANSLRCSAWALQSSVISNPEQVGGMVARFPFGSPNSSSPSEFFPPAIVSPSAVKFSSPLAGKSMASSAHDASSPSGAFNPILSSGFNSTPCLSHRVSCSPLHRDLVRRSVSSTPLGLPTLQSLCSSALIEKSLVPRVMLSLEGGRVSEVEIRPSVALTVDPHTIADLLEVEEDEHTSSFRTFSLSTSSAEQTSIDGLDPTIMSTLTPSRPVFTKRHKSCGDFENHHQEQIPKLDRLRMKSALGLAPYASLQRSTSLSPLPQTPWVLMGTECGQAQKAWGSHNSYFPTFVV